MVADPLELRDDGSAEPADAAAFARDLAESIQTVLADPALADRFGKAGRARAVEQFGWPAISERVVEVYRSVLP